MADNVYNLKFTLSNGDVIDAGQITAPQGPKGDKGDSATIDANTLLALLLGSNGIVIAKNTAGDKVEAKLAIPETGPITLASTQVPRPAVLIEVAQGGPPHAGGISCSREVGGETTYVGPAGIMIDDGAYVLSINNTNDSFIAYTDIHGAPLGQALIGGGPKGNVKTLFGNQSIYGSGNIDLYNHNLVITATATNVSALKALITFTSSSNTKIDSLTDLYTACSKFGEISASGYVTKAGKVCPIYSALCNSGDGIHFIEATLDDTTGIAWTAMTGVTIVDEVTTV